jgi:glycosyltransferase involved in cell wall biosynthesis
MRVLQLCWGYPPESYDGASVSVGELCKGLVAAGLDVAAVSIEPVAGWDGWVQPAGDRRSAAPPLMPGHEKIEGVRVTRVPGDRAWEPVVAVVEAFRPEIIHFHEYRDLALVRHAAGRTGARVVLTIHELFVSEPGQPGSLTDRQGQRDAITFADRIILPSSDAAARLEHHHPAARDRIRVIGHGFEDSVAAQRAAYARPARPDPTLLSCGRISRQKGADVLLSAVPEILRQAPGSRFLLVGVRDYPRQRRQVESWLAALPASVTAHVTVRGWQPRPALSEAYAEADIVIVPSRNEIFGLVTLEAMLHGCALVASRTDGTTSLLQDGQTGLLVPPGDAAALVRATLCLIRDQALRARLGRAAADEARRSHLLAPVAQRMATVYIELCGYFPGRLGRSAGRRRH